MPYLSRESFKSSGGKFEPLPIGDYTATIIECEHKEGETNGKIWQQAVLKFKVDEGAHAGRFIWSRHFYNDPLLGDILSSCGLDLDDLFGTGEQLNTDKLFKELTGNTLEIRLGLRNGYNAVVGVNDEKKLKEEI